MSKKKTGNKAMLEKVNYSINLIKNIKEGREFTKQEKIEILDKYCSTEENNNGYYTPVEICKFMCDCLCIEPGSHVADLSAGIGNMARPLISTYGEIKDNITVDLYEYDSNTSIALEKAWEDYSQVNVIGHTDTLREDINDKYDYILANPPFTLKTDYTALWNVDKKGKPKKGLNILEAFIDKIMLSLKPGGTVAMVVASGIAFKGNATEKLRQYLTKNYNLKLAMTLDSETFEAAGLTGTGVQTLLLIIEKLKTDENKTVYVELEKDDSFLEQLKSIAYHYRITNKQHYIQYNNSSMDMRYGMLKEGVDPELIELLTYEQEKNIKGKCYCCDRDIEEYETMSDKYTLKSNGDSVLVCLECGNDQLMYIDKIKPNLFIDEEDVPVTEHEKKMLKYLIKERDRELEINKLNSFEKKIYLFTNQQRQDVIGESINHQVMKMCQEFQSATDDNVIKIKYPFIINISRHLENTLGLEWIDLEVKSLKIESYKSKPQGKEEWNNRQRYIYSGEINTSCVLYNTAFGIFYYPHNKRVTVYVNYDFICSKSYGMKRLIEESILKELIENDYILY